MPQLDYKVKADVAREGMAYDTTGCVVSAINKNPQAKQIDTITIDTATDDEDYGYTVDGIGVQIDSGTGSSAASIATALAAEHNSKGLISGRVRAEASGADVVLTSRVGGLPDFDTVLAANLAKMTLVATQATAAADDVEFGRLVIMDGQSSGADASGVEILGKLAKATNLTAREVVLTPAAAEGVYEVDVTVEGQTYHGLYETDGSATVAEIVDGLVASLNAALPAETVLAANDTDTLKLTAELAGKDFEYSYGGSTASTTWTVTSDNAGTADTDINELNLGVAMLDHSVEKPRPTRPGQIGGDQFNAKYGPNKSMSVNEDGRTYVVPEGTPVARRSKVYVRLAVDGSNDKLGGFAAAGGTGLALLKNAKWHKVDGSFAVVQTLR